MAYAHHITASRTQRIVRGAQRAFRGALQHLCQRLAIALLGTSAASRTRLAEFLCHDTRYKGPVFRNGRRTLVACGDHCIWTLNGDTGVGLGVLKHGEWQRDDFDVALRLVLQHNGKVAPVFVDVGANIGTQSVYAALSGHFNRVIAIEPEPCNAALIVQNVSMNDLPVQLTVVQKAAGIRRGRLHLHLHDTDSGMHSLQIEPGNRSLEVAVEPLPAILEAHGVAPDDVGFVWMDIEGHEFMVFETIGELLGRKTPIFFEHGRCRLDDRQHARWSDAFRSHGYAAYIIHGKRAHPVDIPDALDIEFGNVLLV